MEITQEELELCSYVIPKKQLEFTLELSKGEEGTFFTNKLKEIAQKVKEITTYEDLYNEDYTHNVGFRYFLGNTEIYCSQLYPDPENPSRPDGYGFGYVILNGNTQMSEWGDIYLPEFKDIPFMEMDYHVPKNITIEEMLYKRHPDDFNNPNEVSDKTSKYKKENHKKLTIKENDIYTVSSDPGLTEEQYYETKYLTEKLIRPFIDDKTRKSELVEAFKNLEEHGVLDIVGKKIDVKDGQITKKGWQELGTALHIYQDKHYETMRYLFVDTENGEIKHQLALTSKIPNRSLITKEDTLQQIVSEYENTNTKIVLCHNHPSGNINPSLDDLKVTEQINYYFTIGGKGKNNLLGHIILDHNEFNVFNAETKSWNKFESLTNENNYEYNKGFPFKKDSKISGTLYLQELAKEINDTNNYNDKYIPFIYIDYDLKINGIQYFHVDRINKASENLKNDVKESILKGNFGAIPIIPDSLYNSLTNKQKENLEKNLAKHVKNGVFVDAYLNKNSISEKYGLDNEPFEIAEKLSLKDIRKITEVTSTFKPVIEPDLFEDKTFNYEVKWESDFDKTYTDNKNPINIVFKSSREALQFQYDFLEKTGEKLNIYYTYKEPTHVYNNESKLIEKKENIPEYKNQKVAVKYIASKLDEAYKTSNNEEINADVRQMQASYIIKSLSNYCEQHKEKLSKITDLTDKIENELFENGNESLKGYSGNRERGLVMDSFKENEMKIINGNNLSVSEPKLQYIKLSQEDIDFYRNTAIVRQEIENGVVNILYRRDKKSNDLYAIFPEHKYTKKDWWEYRDEKGNSKAINPDYLEKETTRPNQTELEKFKEKIQKEIFSDFNIKQNIYPDLQDVPYFKDKKIKNLEELNKKLSEQIEFLKTQNKQFIDSFEKTHSETQKQNNEKVIVNQNEKKLIHQNININSKKRGR